METSQESTTSQSQSQAENLNSGRNNESLIIENKSNLLDKSKTKVVNLNGCRIIKQTLKNLLQRQGWIEDTEYQNCDVVWLNQDNQDEYFRALTTCLNRIPGYRCLCKKKYTHFVLGKMKKYFPSKYDFIPQHFALPEQSDQFIHTLNAKQQQNEDFAYIAKPSAGQEGENIFLIKSLKDFETQKHLLENDFETVVEQYIDNPLLVNKLKFDLRLYLLVTNVDPLVAYLYEEGIARFCTDNYEKPNNENISNQFMHLTNYSININSEKFVHTEELFEKNNGTKQTLTSLIKILEEQGIDTKKLRKDIINLVQLLILSCSPFLRVSREIVYKNKKNRNFQLSGLDILIDENLKPWLIEMNSNPSLEIEYDEVIVNKLGKVLDVNKVDSYIKGNLLVDTINLVSLPIQEQLTIDKFGMYERIQIDQQDVYNASKIYDELFITYSKYFRKTPFRTIQELTQEILKIVNLDAKVDIKDYDPLFYITSVDVEKDLVAFFGYAHILEDIAFAMDPDHASSSIRENQLKNLVLIDKMIEKYFEESTSQN